MKRRLFYPAMATVIAAIVLAGFSPPFYLRGHVPLPRTSAPLTPVLVAHGIVSTLWLALFFVQAVLIARSRTDLHRRLGVIGVLLTVVWIVTATMTTTDALRRGVALFGVDPRVWWLGNNFAGVVEFGGFAGIALALHRRPETHKRLMLLAAMTFAAPALARLVLFVLQRDRSFVPIVVTPVMLLLIVTAILHDVATRRRVHPALLWGGATAMLFPQVALRMADTAAGLAFADLVRGAA